MRKENKTNNVADQAVATTTYAIEDVIDFSNIDYTALIDNKVVGKKYFDILCGLNLKDVAQKPVKYKSMLLLTNIESIADMLADRISSLNMKIEKLEIEIKAINKLSCTRIPSELTEEEELEIIALTGKIADTQNTISEVRVKLDIVNEFLKTYNASLTIAKNLFSESTSAEKAYKLLIDYICFNSKVDFACFLPLAKASKSFAQYDNSTNGVQDERSKELYLDLCNAIDSCMVQAFKITKADNAKLLCCKTPNYNQAEKIKLAKVFSSLRFTLVQDSDKNLVMSITSQNLDYITASIAKGVLAKLQGVKFDTITEEEKVS